MKFLFTMIAALTLTLSVYAQAYEGTIKVKKVEEPAIIMVYDYPQEIVENAIRAKLADKQLKGEKRRGFLVYNRSSIRDITNAPLDYSFKLDESGKNGKEKTTVYLLMTGDNNISGEGARVARNAKSFLEKLEPDVERANTIAQIKKQEEVLVKEEKRLRDLKEDQTELEEKLEKNKKEQESQGKIIQSQKTMLADLKAK